jgi:hypothetical protein
MRIASQFRSSAAGISKDMSMSLPCNPVNHQPCRPVSLLQGSRYPNKPEANYTESKAMITLDNTAPRTIDNADPDSIIEQINLAGSRHDIKQSLRNLTRKFPFVVEWVSYADLKQEEWSPGERPMDLLYASFDGKTLTECYGKI